MHRRAGILVQCLALMLARIAFVSLPARACTVFMLTDTNATLFCSNYDWFNPRSRIWFQPAEKDRFGAVYAGTAAATGFPQCGMNFRGLAFGWVGGMPQAWEPSPDQKLVRGFAVRHMLESCATVQDAIGFYRTHYDQQLRHATLLLADQTGASATIDSADGKLRVEEDHSSHGFGFGDPILEVALARKPAATVPNGSRLLRDCRQPGAAATRFSIVYDLRAGEVFLYPPDEPQNELKFNLSRELQKGGHYYDIPRVKEQLSGAIQPLPPALKRFPLDEFKPLSDQQPELTAHVRDLVRNLVQGTSRPEDYILEAWKALSEKQKQVQDDMKPLGEFLSATLVERHEEKSGSDYRYRVEFAKVIVLDRFVFDEHGKVRSGVTEAMEWKPGVPYPDLPLPAVVGIGVALGVQGANLVITAILDKSPAAAEPELHVGDRVLAVAQDAGPAVAVASSKPEVAATLMRGAPGTSVRLTVASPNEAPTRARVLSFRRADLRSLSQ